MIRGIYCYKKKFVSKLISAEKLHITFSTSHILHTGSNFIKLYCRLIEHVTL